MTVSTLSAETIATVRGPRRALTVALALGILAVLFAYRETFGTMVEKWDDDAAFSYGFAIAPLSLWLAGRRRDWLRRVRFSPSWLGTAGVAAAGALWIMAKGTGVLVVEQLAVVLMLQALVPAVLGTRATRALLFPVAFLVFLVPFGRAVVPYLVDVTADIATVLLSWSGVPVFRTHTLINIPGGWFQVAKACSGVSFLMTALVLGLLHAQISFTNWKKRVVVVVLACVIPVIANALRVYITIGVSHLTDMNFGPGREHVTFGQIFFVSIMLATLWLSRRWHDDPAPVPAWIRETDVSPSRDAPALVWLPAIAAGAALLIPPIYHNQLVAQLKGEAIAIRATVNLPSPAPGWTGPVEVAGAWRPLYKGGMVERQGTYAQGTGASVDVFVASYILGATDGAEMISYGNVLYAEEMDLVPDARVRRLDLDKKTLTVQELVAPGGALGELVWYWYIVGDRTTTSPYSVKALEALAWVTRGARDERVVTLATPNDEGASSRLEAFVRAHGRCVAAGFAAGACGP